MCSLRRRPYTGLALGGGGARGLAHIGVLKILLAAGIPIDCLAGTSMGGLLGAIFASGLAVKGMEAEALKMAAPSQMIRLVDLTPPRRGLLRGERVQRYIEQLVGRDRVFADLNLPLAVTAVDLGSSLQVVLSQGSVVQAVMATIAVPGIFPPRELNAHLLVDGGVLNNVPADIVRSMGAEFVIAVDVNAGHVPYWPTNELAQNPFIARLMPAFMIDMLRAEMIMLNAITETRLNQARPDVLIQPKIPNDVTAFMGFSRAVDLIAWGEKAALAALPKIQRALKPRLRLPRRPPRRPSNPK